MLRVAARVLCQRSSPSTSLSSCALSVIHRRYTENDNKTDNLSIANSSDRRKNTDNVSEGSKVKSPSRVTVMKKYWIFRYVDYVKNYEQVMEKNFPTTMHVYRVFSVGTKVFYQDLKRFLKVSKKIRKQGIDTLSTDELQLAFTMPKDLIRISPVLLISAIPFTFYIIFPLALYFPHVVLTSHYWSIQDKLNFMLKEHKQRLKHNKPLFRCFQSQINKIKDQKLQESVGNIVACLGSGTHPTVEDILQCKSLFSGLPYSLKHIKRKHVKELLKVHGMSTYTLRKRKKLLERGLLIKRMDAAIQREGGPSMLSYDAIRWALSFRGLNPVNMSLDSMQSWLDQWLLISSKVDADSISLLLHCPILLAYNHETNWTLLYHSQQK
ncbi:LETM1 domain-containing protein 1 [Trichogramma pretiosum]|uniref:LETM1 domain-containing protein 1 n=1 Tax=Trichogramma pretiosum TaxID=7493 RepID=UPI0006C99FDC|nr:LETM1 domain-containing protein 1 [Trichogramma pretiosum]